MIGADFPIKVYRAIWQSKRWPAAVARLLIAVGRDLHEGYLTLRATSLVYTTLLSFAPLLAICFSVLKGMGAHDQIEPFLRKFLEPLGGQSADIAARIVEFVDKIQVGVLGSVGLILLVYSVISLMSKIETAFNDIWRVPNARPFALRLRDYLSVLLIGPLFLFLSVGMTASVQHMDFFSRYLDINMVNIATTWIFSIVPYVLFMLAFAALYMFMPNTNVKAGPALTAGFVTGVMWKLLGWLFGIFVTGSASYAAIYSAFAALVLFMIWLYTGWLIVLAGASICYYLQNPSNQRLPRSFRHLGTRNREKLALQIVAEIGADFYGAQAGYDAQALAAKLLLPAIVVEDVVNDLMHIHVLTVSEEGAKHYVPARPLDATTVDHMLTALRGIDGGDILNGDRLVANDTIERLMHKSDEIQAEIFGKITLKQLAMEEKA